MSQITAETGKKAVRQHIQDGRTLNSLTAEYESCRIDGPDYCIRAGIIVVTPQMKIVLDYLGEYGAITDEELKESFETIPNFV